MSKDRWSKLKKYKGLWVAMYREKVVGFGKTLIEAYRRAQKFCKNPVVFLVPDNPSEVYLL